MEFELKLKFISIDDIVLQVQNGEDKDREIALYSMPLGKPGLLETQRLLQRDTWEAEQWV